LHRSGFWKNRSIKFRIILIFFLINLLMIGGFIVTFLGQNAITAEYNRLMYNNIILGKLSLKIEQCSRLFDKYLLEKKAADLKEMRETNQQITSQLARIGTDVQKDENSAIYHRYLTNMQENQIQLVDRLLSQKVYNQTTYRDLSYLKMLYQYMQRQSQQLVVAYLEYSSSRYIALQDKALNFQNRIFVVVIIVSLATIFLALVFTNRIFRVIAQLSRTAKRLAAGDWEIPDIKENRYQDLNLMVAAFNNMKKSIRQYIMEINQKTELEIQLNKAKLANVEKERLLKESRLLALQMQMNPHFLFNTLNLIGRMAMFQETDTTIKLIESISKILRYNLQNESTLVSLENELKVVRSYMYIQKIRFQGRISFSLQVFGDIRHADLPPMIIQPLVENAIVHGLKDEPKEGRIEIIVTRERESVKVVVSDNGIGMSKEKQEELFNETAGLIKEERKSIGLANVKKRLELHFEKLNLINIISEPGKGTAIVVNIPVMEDTPYD
jgi:two-component system sensor histidine kinase YesM